jgi:hypothetical protein
MWEPPSAPFSPCSLLSSAPRDARDSPGAPHLFSAFLKCPAVSGIPESENLVPKTAPCPPPAELGSSGFPQPDTQPGPYGKHGAVFCICPLRALELWQDEGFLPLPLSPTPSANNYSTDSEFCHFGTILIKCYSGQYDHHPEQGVFAIERGISSSQASMEPGKTNRTSSHDAYNLLVRKSKRFDFLQIIILLSAGSFGLPQLLLL